MPSIILSNAVKSVSDVLLSGAGQDIIDILKELGGGIIGDKENKTKIIVYTVNSLIGSKPKVNRSDPDVNVISFTKKQRAKLESYMDKSKTDSTGKPANVKIDHQSIWLPYALKRGIPIALGFAVLGFLAGRYLK